MSEASQKNDQTGEECTPEWFVRNYISQLLKRVKNYDEFEQERKKEDAIVSEMTLSQLDLHIGGSTRGLPYQDLRCLLPNGSSDAVVGDILREKRRIYLLNHQDEVTSRDASKGVSTFDGRFISRAELQKMSAEELRGVFVGTTCSHYNSGADSQWTTKYGI